MRNLFHKHSWKLINLFTKDDYQYKHERYECVECHCGMHVINKFNLKKPIIKITRKTIEK